jgi:hypothetical protein
MKETMFRNADVVEDLYNFWSEVTLGEVQLVFDEWIGLRTRQRICP